VPGNIKIMAILIGKQYCCSKNPFLMIVTDENCLKEEK
jgi:hypothetical protein